ncbi:MAG: hypothetical protein IPN40_10225 [Uliginosibacterium sp.]|nr:hypothetical protein [Uliginosibacterium sp.]
MKLGLSATTGLAGLGAMLALIQFALCPWTSEVFVRLEIMLLGPLAIVLTVRFLTREYEEDQITRRGEKLDE